MQVKLYGYKKCSTCKEAEKYLRARGVHVEFIDVLEEPLPVSIAKAWFVRTGLGAKPFLNTRGTVFRQRQLSVDAYDDTGWAQEIHEDGKLMKRPVIDNGVQICVGFNKAEYDLMIARG